MHSSGSAHLKSYQRGFTLIEILVVVAIIGIITAVVMVSLSTARSKGRDARRKADLAQLQKALELYETDDHPTNYPTTGGNCQSGTNWGGIADNANSNYKQLSGANGWIPNLAPAYISQLPVDPKALTTGWSGYLYCSDGISYKLLAHDTGPESFPNSTEPFYDPVRPTWAWMVCVGQTACETW